MDVMFSELARAYLESPRTFMRVDVDDHGPPLELARELDLIDELNSYLNSPKQLELLLDSPDPSPIDSPIIDILPPPELIPVSYSVDPEGETKYVDETSSSPLPISAHVNFSSDPTPPTSSLTTASTTVST